MPDRQLTALSACQLGSQYTGQPLGGLPLRRSLIDRGFAPQLSPREIAWRI